MHESTVIGDRVGRTGRLLLNRPDNLNALDIGMIRAIHTALECWRDDPSVHAVLVEGVGGRAFCAGGDVRALRDYALAGDEEPIRSFFREEYALNAAIAGYPKPYITLVDGICMGGGVGISIHGRMTVTTEAGVFAMPETGIGLFPDVGCSYALPRMPGSIGIYMGLSGQALGGADAVHAGLATHFVHRADLEALRGAVTHDGAAAVAAFARTLPPFSLADRRAAIDRCFGASSVPGIVTALEAESCDWSRSTLQVLRSVSPSSLFWTMAIMRRGAGLSLRAALSEEFRLACNAVMHDDFHEGVRAALVDKDRRPGWSPPRIEDVDPDAIMRMLTD